MTKATTELLERASALSVDKKNYEALTTPPLSTAALEGGALCEGAPPRIFSKELLGLQVQYVSAGLVYTVLYLLIYPFLNNYLRMSGVETTSALVLLSLPYTLKVFFGIFSDCYPLWGYRRRPYMVLGWIVCTACCFVMIWLPIGDPYYPDPAYALVDPTTLSPEIVATFNTAAPTTGLAFIWLIVIANLGMVMAGTAAGGIMVELSQREPEKIRGQLQTLIWISTDVGMIGASALVGFGLNSADFGGTFAGSVGVPGLMAICAVTSAATAVSSWFNIREERAGRLSVRAECAKLFGLMQFKVVYYVLAFQLLRNMFSYVSVTAAYPIQSIWAKVEPVNSSIASTLSFLISAVSLSIVAKYGLNWSWRGIIIIAQVVVVAIDCAPTFMTIWDVYRSQWFWLGVPLLEKVPSNFAFIVATFCMVEIIDEGNEATVYGLVGSAASLASPFSGVITKNVDANFDIGFERLQADDHDVRMQVTYAYLAQYAFQLFSLVFVVLLPRQKAETQAMKRQGDKSFAIGVICVVVFAFLLVWAVVTNIMSIYPSTACLVIAGGTGCA